MDIFLEQLVVKNHTKSDQLKKVALCIGAALVVVFAFFVLPLFGGISSTIGIVLVLVAIGFTFYLISNMRLEYEYIFTNGELDIDCIKAKTTRNRILSVKVKTFQEFGVYHSGEQGHLKYDNKVSACGPEEEGETYFAVFQHGKRGTCILLFNPNQTIRTQIQQYMVK